MEPADEEWLNEDPTIETQMETIRCMQRGWTLYKKEKRIKKASQPAPEDHQRPLPGEQEEAEVEKTPK